MLTLFLFFSHIYNKHLNVIIMGRKKLTSEIKRNNLSITISKENKKLFGELGIKNKSKLIEWLLNNYFETLKIK